MSHFKNCTCAACIGAITITSVAAGTAPEVPKSVFVVLAPVSGGSTIFNGNELQRDRLAEYHL